MISAKKIRENTEIGKAKTQIKTLEKQITKAADLGRHECFTTEKLTDATQNELENAGYTVINQVDRFKICW